MRGICASVSQSWGQWQDWRADASAHRAPLPGVWEDQLNRFQKLIVVRALAKVTCTTSGEMFLHISGGLKFLGAKRRRGRCVFIQFTLKRALTPSSLPCSLFFSPLGPASPLGAYNCGHTICTTPKANTHSAAADLVEHHLGREMVRPSGTAAGVDEASATMPAFSWLQITSVNFLVHFHHRCYATRRFLCNLSAAHMI